MYIKHYELMNYQNMALLKQLRCRRLTRTAVDWGGGGAHCKGK